MLYNALSTYEWSSIYNGTFVDAAIDRLNVAARQAMDLAITAGHIKTHKCHIWFSDITIL